MYTHRINTNTIHRSTTMNSNFLYNISSRPQKNTHKHRDHNVHTHTHAYTRTNIHQYTRTSAHHARAWAVIAPVCAPDTPIGLIDCVWRQVSRKIRSKNDLTQPHTHGILCACVSSWVHTHTRTARANVHHGQRCEQRGCASGTGGCGSSKWQSCEWQSQRQERESATKENHQL